MNNTDVRATSVVAEGPRVSVETVRVVTHVRRIALQQVTVIRNGTIQQAYDISCQWSAATTCICCAISGILPFSQCTWLPVTLKSLSLLFRSVHETDFCAHSNNAQCGHNKHSGWVWQSWSAKRWGVNRLRQGNLRAAPQKCNILVSQSAEQNDPLCGYTVLGLRLRQITGHMFEAGPFSIIAASPGKSAGFWLGGSMPPCRLRRRIFRK